MRSFNNLFESILLKENVTVLTYPNNDLYKQSYEKLNSFVNGNQSKPVPEVISSMGLENIKQLNMSKEQVDKIINVSKKNIPGLNNISVEYLFYPNNLVANLYNAANNANSDFKRYEMILTAYNEYKNKKSSDTLSALIVTINTSDQPGRLAAISRYVINSIVNIVPGSSVATTALLGSIAGASPNLLPLAPELNNVGNNIQAVKNTGILPGTILEDITKESVKSFSLLSVGAVTAHLGDKTVTKAKELADKTKKKTEELLNKTKEELSKYADKSGKNFFDMTHSNRKPGSMASPRVQLRGQAGARTPAVY